MIKRKKRHENKAEKIYSFKYLSVTQKRTVIPNFATRMSAKNVREEKERFLIKKDFLDYQYGQFSRKRKRKANFFFEAVSPKLMDNEQ